MSAAFITPVPCQHRTHGRVSRCAPQRSPHVRASASDPDRLNHQWSQYESRDENVLRAERNNLARTRTLDRHYHVFVQEGASGAFRAAARRFVDGMRATEWPPENRLLVLQQVEDPTFGTLRGPPNPPRSMLVESFDAPVASGAESSESAALPQIARWVAALDRAGAVVTPMESHYCEYARIAAVSRDADERRGKVIGGESVVACEILNADWTNSSSIQAMRGKLIAQAQNAVHNGSALHYEVLQSMEPTCFKTLEVYASLDALRKHMSTLDPPFAEDMLECRAAVNRVRQLYLPLETLHEGVESLE